MGTQKFEKERKELLRQLENLQIAVHAAAKDSELTIRGIAKTYGFGLSTFQNKLNPSPDIPSCVNPREFVAVMYETRDLRIWDAISKIYWSSAINRNELR
jgi:hypothetical protein